MKTVTSRRVIEEKLPSRAGRGEKRDQWGVARVRGKWGEPRGERGAARFVSPLAIPRSFLPTSPSPSPLPAGLAPPLCSYRWRPPIHHDALTMKMLSALVATRPCSSREKLKSP
jgi:hypothetical protein